MRWTGHYRKSRIFPLHLYNWAQCYVIPRIIYLHFQWLRITAVLDFYCTMYSLYSLLYELLPIDNLWFHEYFIDFHQIKSTYVNFRSSSNYPATDGWVNSCNINFFFENQRTVGFLFNPAWLGGRFKCNWLTDRLNHINHMLTSLFSTCRPYRDRQKPANGTRCPTLAIDS